jgi:multisubunit Na+/H+ antiporter MnhC subunit
MSLAVRFVILTFIVVGIYLLVRNSALYKTAIGYGASLFSRAYSALVTGRQDV